jgi:Putative Ig domain
MVKRGKSSLLFCLSVLVCACLETVGCAGTPTTFHSVVITPSAAQTLGENETLAITSRVLNDSSNAGVTWTLSSTTGTLSGSTTTSTTYTAPALVSAPTMLSVKATSVTFPTQSASVQITVEPAPVITTISLPGGNYGSPYSATINMTGGVPPYTWSIASGSLTPGLSLGANTTNSDMITGTPTAQTNSTFTVKVTDSTGNSVTQALSIVIGPPLPLHVSTTTTPNAALNESYSSTLQASGGVPPFTWTLTSAPSTLPPGLTLAADGTLIGTPTSTGTFNFSVQVADSESPAMTATANVSITVTNLGLLTGNYAFIFHGFNSTGGQVVVAGTFVADGRGNITSGGEDFNSLQGPPKNSAALTGTYAIGNDGRGTLTFSNLSPAPAYAISLNASGTHGRIIEFDSTTGIRGSGELDQRSVTTCTAQTLNASYALGITGQESSAAGVPETGPAVVVGSFTATPSTIGPGEFDANTPGGITTQQTLSGTYQTTGNPDRCSVALSTSLSSSNINFALYPVSSSEAFMIETDQVSATSPFVLAGTLLEQFATGLGLAGSTFTGTSVGALTGQILSGNTYLPDVAIISITGTANPSFTISAVENQAGTVTVTAPTAGPLFVNADQFGRMDTNLTAPFEPVFYVINDNEAFCIGESIAAQNPFFGLLEPQSTGPFTASSINGSFIEGTFRPPTSAVRDTSGALTLANTSSTAGTITGTEDISTTTSNTTSAVTGTYDITSSTAGSGTINLTAPAALTADFYVITPFHVVGVTTTTGDTDPVVFTLGN